MCFKERGNKEQRMNPSLPKQIKTLLCPEREVLIAHKDDEIKQKQKSIQDDLGIANDENEDRATRERERERITEN